MTRDCIWIAARIAAQCFKPEGGGAPSAFYVRSWLNPRADSAGDMARWPSRLGYCLTKKMASSRMNRLKVQFQCQL